MKNNRKLNQERNSSRHLFRIIGTMITIIMLATLMSKFSISVNALNSITSPNYQSTGKYVLIKKTKVKTSVKKKYSKTLKSKKKFIKTFSNKTASILSRNKFKSYLKVKRMGKKSKIRSKYKVINKSKHTVKIKIAKSYCSIEKFTIKKSDNDKSTSTTYWTTSDNGGPLDKRNDKLEGLTYANTYGGGRAIVAPDEGINWDRDLEQVHTWESNGPTATWPYTSFGSWDGDLEGQLPGEDTGLHTAWWHQRWTYNKTDLSLKEWIDKYFDIKYSYKLIDTPAIESHKKFGMKLEDPLFEISIADQDIYKPSNQLSSFFMPVVTLSDVSKPPVPNAKLIFYGDDGNVSLAKQEFIVSYNVYGGTGQWASWSYHPDTGSGRLCWAIQKTVSS